MVSQRGQQNRLACWTLVNSESDSVVLYSILLSGPQYLSYSRKQSIAWVPLLHQKIQKDDNVSNSLCFKKEKQLTREVDCCFLKQYLFLMWLWGKAISHSTKWTKFRGTLPRAKSSFTPPGELQMQKEMKAHFFYKTEDIVSVNSFMHKPGIYAIYTAEKWIHQLICWGQNPKLYACIGKVLHYSW